METVVIALGGNALVGQDQEGTAEEQKANLEKPMRQVVNLIERGYRIAITHGNGFQVGNLLLQQEASGVPMPLDVCVAQTQGQIGSMIEEVLRNELLERDIRHDIVSIVTHIIVDRGDPEFKHPTKPIGPFYTGSEANGKPFETKQIDERGYRRVVPSPKPELILEAEEIESLLDRAVVICCGGGGVPVVDGVKVEGVEAVIDKDLASAVLASAIGADLLVILTGVDKVAIKYKKPGQNDLDKMTVKEAENYFKKGHFPEGSMGPKVQAAVQFLKEGGKRAVITSLDHLEGAIEGVDGTQIVK